MPDVDEPTFDRIAEVLRVLGPLEELLTDAGYTADLTLTVDIIEGQEARLVALRVRVDDPKSIAPRP